jgi:hypothetical protein
MHFSNLLKMSPENNLFWQDKMKLVNTSTFACESIFAFLASI